MTARVKVVGTTMMVKVVTSQEATGGQWTYSQEEKT
jgi:hypothetical protein